MTEEERNSIKYFLPDHNLVIQNKDIALKELYTKNVISSYSEKFIIYFIQYKDFINKFI
jgi:hypothetical protein